MTNEKLPQIRDIIAAFKDLQSDVVAQRVLLQNEWMQLDGMTKQKWDTMSPQKQFVLVLRDIAKNANQLLTDLGEPPVIPHPKNKRLH